MKTMKRILASFLATLMILSALPFGVFAQEWCEHMYQYEMGDDMGHTAVCMQCGESFWETHDSISGCGLCGYYGGCMHEYGYQAEDEWNHAYMCMLCGEYSHSESHWYDDENDMDCNVCYYMRSPLEHNCWEIFYYTVEDDQSHGAYCCTCNSLIAFEEHVFDDASDSDCYYCGYTREVHICREYTGVPYDESSHYYTCPECGMQVSLEEHIYASDLDTDCDVCGFVREIENEEADESLFTYVIENAGAKITGYTTKPTGKLVLPSSLGGYSVTQIGERAFEDCWSLSEVVFPDTLQYIGKCAFRYCALQSVTFPKSLAAFEYDAFASNQISSLSVEEGNSTYRSVNNCILQGDKVVLGCKTSVLPTDGSITGIGDHAFYGTGITELTIPEGVTAIGTSAFWGCHQLTSVTFPESLISLGSGAFASCGITSVHLPKNLVDFVGKTYGPFESCSALESITVDAENPAYYSENNCVIDKESHSLVIGCKNSVIPSDGSVLVIGADAFNGIRSLTEIVIPNTVKYISEAAFCATGLTEIKIPESVGLLYYNAFATCTNLEKVYLGSGVTQLLQGAFYNCPNLTDVYYSGTAAEKDGIYFGPSNDAIHSATWHYEVCFGSETVGTHVYATSCQVACSVCQKAREVEHTYENGCDESCNVCGNIRTDIHSYTNGYDTTCNDCGAERETSYTSEEYFAYEIENGGAVITGFDPEYEGDVIIPLTLGGYPVTKIGDKAFASCWKITSLFMPDTVTELGGNAFAYCSSLYTVSLSSALTEIPYFAFESCYNLSEITIPEGVTAIGDFAFAYCYSLPTPTFHEGLESIGSYAFYCCSQIENVVIPAGVTSLGSCIFASVWNLQSITVAEGNENYMSENGVLFDADQSVLIAYPVGKTDSRYVVPSSVTHIADTAFIDNNLLVEVVLPEGLLEIGAEAFSCCTSLQFINLPSTLQTIASYAFLECRELTFLTIPASVTEIGEGAFSACYGIFDVVVDSNNPAFSAENGVLFNKDKTTLLFYPIAKEGEEYVIPASVTSIAPRAFRGCALQSVQLPAGLTAIGDEAFGLCPNLTSVTIPSGVEIIEPWTFSDCISLETLYLPKSVKTIYECAFLGSPLQKVYYAGSEQAASKITIYENNETLLEAEWEYQNVACDHVYDNDLDPTCNECGETREIYLTGTTGDLTFELTGTKLVISGNGAMADYSETDPAPWGNAITEVVISDGVTALGTRAFYNCKNIVSVTVGDTVVSVGDYSFYGCENIISISLGNNVTAVGDYSFYNCKNLLSISLGNNVTAIGNYSFYNCENLTAINLGNRVTAIGNYSFYNCKNMVEVNVGQSVTAIGDYSFYGCESMPEITLPGTVESIGSSAFAACPSLGNVWYTGSPEEWEDVEIGSDNDALTEADKSYNACVGVNGTYSDHSYDDCNDSVCDNCGTQRLAPGHVYTDCADSYCNNCSAERVAPDHDFSNYHVAERYLISRANCKSAAVYCISCSVCHAGSDMYFTYGEIDPDRHAGGTALRGEREATCTEKGYTGDVYCLDCSVIITKGTVTDFAEHVYDNDDDATCNTCGADRYAEQVIPGDMNGDGAVTSDDAIYLLYHTVFGSDRYPIECDADLNGDGAVSSEDAVYLLYHTLFPERYPLSQKTENENGSLELPPIIVS